MAVLKEFVTVGEREFYLAFLKVGEMEFLKVARTAVSMGAQRVEMKVAY